MGAAPPVLSVVVPIFNEESVLPLFVARLRTVLDSLGETYEVVAVDDGSVDATPAALSGARRQWPQLRVVRLRRNSGHQAALIAGLMRAHGTYVASIDADLQDPPETILEMLRLARDEHLDIVYGVRNDRHSDTLFKRWTAGLYYKIMRRLVGKQVPAHAGDFRLLSRAAVEALRELPERSPVLRLVVPWLGFPSGEVLYQRAGRAAGRTKYPLSKMFALATDSITSFSSAPLRVATWLGLIGVIVSGVLAVIAVVAFFLDETVRGWPSLFIAIVFLGAVQLLFLGLLGEYVARIYTSVQARPAYYIASDSENAPAENVEERQPDAETAG
ncbi:glycosyltransferase family 2 protein [Tenggerimyces flavus]|uniref:Glycosyltransferase n=1 Tax=Tenggerimyces flavus TaxID=1708749 RepID=A0ABV7YP79_9ACTN|nr:glycosyltransferase family 2 protein [Tenggerimyces flavus]MBM7784634.1 dolichol-phosphate mannosyltransferase [Tenggerimyces flavus]